MADLRTRVLIRATTVATIAALTSLHACVGWSQVTHGMRSAFGVVLDGVHFSVITVFAIGPGAVAWIVASEFLREARSEGERSPC